MRITIDGLSLLQWCQEHQRNYQNTRNALISALRLEGRSTLRRLKLTPEEIKRRVLVRNRCRRGYTIEEASLPDDEFEKLRAQRIGVHKIGKYNLCYVCNKLGIKYNTVLTYCVRDKKMTPREYLESKGFDLTEFEQ